VRIGIDVHSIGSGNGGNETYYRQLIKALFRIDTENQYLLYATRAGAGALRTFSSRQFKICQLTHVSPYTRIPFAMPTQAGRDSLDIFHAQFIIPPFLSARAVTTIPDIAYEYFPEFFPMYQRAWSKALIRWSARRADHIITVSEYSKRAIANAYQVPEEKITVTHEAAGEEFIPLNKDRAREEIARTYGIEDDFILYLGRLQVRKNLAALVEGYARARRAGITHKLVLAGKQDSLFAPVLARIRELDLQSHVLLPGYIPAEDVPKFYNAAAVFVYPSIYEGFGLPVLEAMACRTPVITSRGGALEEVAGVGALLVDPPDDLAIAKALEIVLHNPEVREQLSFAGLKRSSEFSLSEMGKRTIEVYEKVAGIEARRERSALRRSA
jgi:glycosyltransferase involved in cell wall biosynthesis